MYFLVVSSNHFLQNVVKVLFTFATIFLYTYSVQYLPQLQPPSQPSPPPPHNECKPTQNHLGAVGVYGGLDVEPCAEHVGGHSAQAVAGEVQVGEVPDVERGVAGDGRDLVVVEVQETQIGHVRQGLPGEGGKRVPVQAQLVQAGQATETVHVQRGKRVEGHPQELQVAEVMEGLAGDACDGRLLDAQLGRVQREVGWDVGDVWVIAEDAPGERKIDQQFALHSFPSTDAEG